MHVGIESSDRHDHAAAAEVATHARASSSRARLSEATQRLGPGDGVSSSSVRVNGMNDEDYVSPKARR
jgi:hypothetical protein